MQNRILTVTAAVLLSVGAQAEDKPKADAASGSNEARPQPANGALQPNKAEGVVITGSATLAPGAVPPGAAVKAAPDGGVVTVTGTAVVGAAVPAGAAPMMGTIKVQAGGAIGGGTVIIEQNGVREVREVVPGQRIEFGGVIADPNAAGLAPDVKPTAYLGMSSEELSADRAAVLRAEPGSGVLVRSVAPDGPAAAAGLQKDDVLLKLDGKPLTSPGQLQKLVGTRKAGDTIKFSVLRNGQSTELEAKLAPVPDPKAKP